MISRLALAAPLILATGTATAASTQTVWQGDMFVTAITSACTPTQVATVGDYYRVIYRPKLSSTDPAEGLSFVGSRSDYLVTSAATSGTLQGSVSYNGVYISSHATTGKATGTSQLSITPAPITATTTTVTLSGTVTNWFATTGCTITFRAAATRRP